MTITNEIKMKYQHSTLYFFCPLINLKAGIASKDICTSLDKFKLPGIKNWLSKAAAQRPTQKNNTAYILSSKEKPTFKPWYLG